MGKIPKNTVVLRVNARSGLVPIDWRPSLMRLCPDNASRLCGWDGVWAERTDYSACKLLDQNTSVMEEVEMEEDHADLEISIIIYLIGEMSRT